MIQEGDIIMSQCFANGYLLNEDSTVIIVDGSSSEHYVTHTVSDEEGRAHFEKMGVLLPETMIINLSRFDITRAYAKFVVEKTSFILDGNPHAYRYRRFVAARRLQTDASDNTSGEIIRFYLAGRSDIPIAVKDIRIVGRMKV